MHSMVLDVLIICPWIYLACRLKYSSRSRPAGAKGRGKAEARMAGEQRTLEAYS